MRTGRRWVGVVSALGMIAACGQAAAATSSGSASQPLAVADLKYRVMAAVGPLQYCDPDLYPVARAGAAQQNSLSQYPTIRSSADTYAAILRHLGLHDPLDDGQKLAVYSEWKLLGALVLHGSSPGSFDQVFRTGAGAAATLDEVSGSVSPTGEVHVDSTRPGRLNCPI